jgi:hypothetical protein
MKDAQHTTDVEADEACALRAAVDRAKGDRRSVPHAEVRAWLLRIAAGDTDAPPPVPRAE